MVKRQPIAFMSYTNHDNRYDIETLTRFRERLSGEVHMHTGEEFVIFQDRRNILWGQNWRERIEQSFDGATFLIPIITPSFFASSYCREELQRFLEREQKLNRSDLILPIYYVSCPLLDDKAKRATDKLAQAIATHLYADWRELRYDPYDSPQIRRQSVQLAIRIRDALQRTQNERSHAPIAALTMSSIFLSHNHADKPFVRRLAQDLKAEGVRVWLDEAEMMIGDSLIEKIREGIDQMEFVGVILSQNSVKSRWVREEIDIAMNQQIEGKRVKVLPLVIEDCELPGFLKGKLYADFRESARYGEEFAKVLRRLGHSPRIEELRSRLSDLQSIVPSHEFSALLSTPQETLQGFEDTASRVEPTEELFEAMFASLSQHYGEQNWWVRDNKFQLCLEAILSQGTSWKNVGLAVNNLQQRNALTPQNIDEMPLEHLRGCIHPCGRSNQKSRYIKNFVHYLGTRYDMSIEQMLTQDTDTLRNELLAIEGIGQFTCDNILLYAGDRLKIPINDRMKKVLFEHDLVDRKESYVDVQRRIESTMPFDTRKVREFDAMIYRVAKDYCRDIPQCRECPLQALLPSQTPRSQRT